ncbi:MAG: bacterio-opsin activator domain-containing protein [Halobacteriota archaeon]|uniref:bacterio-opsin activator domain-containing protein n=1 Tax=Natronomonas sp. TaxID=2184060 RepID=UPI0039767CC0
MSKGELGISGIEVLESMPDLACVIDREGRLQWWNDRFRKVTGYGDEALEDRHVFDLVASSDRDIIRVAFERIDDKPPDRTVAIDVRTEDGERRPYEFNGRPIQTDFGSGIVCIGRELTGRNKRELEIRRHRDELGTLNRISETVYNVIHAVIDAADRDELEAAVCERLSASDLYRSVWIGRTEPNADVTPSVGVSPSDDFLSAVKALNDADWDRPAAKAIETGEVQVSQRISELDIPEQLKEMAEERNTRSGIAVPISYQDTILGVLGVYSPRPDAFGRHEQAAFERLGEIIGFGIHIIRTQRLVLAETSTELTFRAEKTETLLGELSMEATGECTYEWSQSTSVGTYRHLITIRGLEPDRVLEIARDRSDIEEISHLSGDREEGIYEFVLLNPLIEQFFDAGAVLVSIVARDGVATFVVEVPGRADIRAFVEMAESRYDATLVSKRELDRPIRTAGEFWKTVSDQLTERQRTALRHAHLRGYFSWPRDATAEEIAGSMCVSSPTFHYHIRNAQRALVEAYFENLDT